MFRSTTSTFKHKTCYDFQFSISLFFLVVFGSVIMADSTFTARQKPTVNAAASVKNDTMKDSGLQLSLDHIVLATNNLDKGIRLFEKQVDGCRPTIGGTHDSLGTKNALLGVRPPKNIEDQTTSSTTKTKTTTTITSAPYIEILGPDPDNPGKSLGVHLQEQTRHDGQDDENNVIDDTTCLFPFHFAIRCTNLSIIQQRALKLGFKTTDIINMSRRMADGKTIVRWKFLFITGHELGGIIPFFIDWLDSEHPSIRLVSTKNTKNVNIGPKDENMNHDGEDDNDKSLLPTTSTSTCCKSVSVILEVPTEGYKKLIALMGTIDGIEYKEIKTRKEDGQQQQQQQLPKLKFLITSPTTTTKHNDDNNNDKVIEYSRILPKGIEIG